MLIRFLFATVVLLHLCVILFKKCLLCRTSPQALYLQNRTFMTIMCDLDMCYCTFHAKLVYCHILLDIFNANTIHFNWIFVLHTEKKNRTFHDQIANRQQDGYGCQQKGHKTKCKKDRSRCIFFTFCNQKVHLSHGNFRVTFYCFVYF